MPPAFTPPRANTPPPASPTMIGTSSGQFGQVALNSADALGTTAAALSTAAALASASAAAAATNPYPPSYPPSNPSPATYFGQLPLGQDGVPTPGGFLNPAAQQGLSSSTQPTAFAGGVGANSGDAAGFPEGPSAGLGGGGGPVSSTPIADSVLLGHMLGDNASPRPNNPLPVNPAAPTPIADSVLLGHILGDNAAPRPDAPLPSVNAGASDAGTSDGGIGAVPSMPSVGAGQVGGQVSSTPISDSVLLGHLVGDEAAPGPDQPLPVVQPEPPTSGIPKEVLPPFLIVPLGPGLRACVFFCL